MEIIKHCPNCGCVISEQDTEFCTECGFNLAEKSDNISKRPFNHLDVKNDGISKGFFDNLAIKTSFPIILFSFVVFGAFLFIGSIFWSSFLASGSIDLITFLLLIVVFSVFFGGIFVGYFGCKDETYVLPNFLMYLGSIFAVVLCGIGLIFSFLMGIFSAISSAFSSMDSNSLYGGTTSSFASSIDLSSIFKIILFVLLIPVAAYFGVYLGYYLKQNI